MTQNLQQQIQYWQWQKYKKHAYGQKNYLNYLTFYLQAQIALTDANRK